MSMRLNCILQYLSRDTTLDHIWRAHIRSHICQIWSNMPNMVFGPHIWARQIWSSRVSIRVDRHSHSRSQNFGPVFASRLGDVLHGGDDGDVDDFRKVLFVCLSLTKNDHFAQRPQIIFFSGSNFFFKHCNKKMFSINCTCQQKNN